MQKRFFHILLFTIHLFSYSVNGQQNQPIDENFVKGFKAFQAQNFTQALWYFDLELKSKPQAHEALFMKGKCKIEQQDYNTALDNFSKASQIAPQDAEYHFFRGFCEWKLKRLKNASKSMEQALEYEPKNFLAHQILGSIYHELKIFKKAKEHYDKAIQIEPDFSSKIINKQRTDDYRDAYRTVIKDYSKSIKSDPENAYVYFNNGILQAIAQDNYGAHANFTKCIEINPDFVFCYYYRGLINYKMQKLKDAMTDFHKFCKAFPEDEVSQTLMATINEQSKIRVLESSGDEILLVAEVMPEFEGGMKGMMKYIRDNLEYPSIALERKIAGRVIVSFVVDGNGEIKFPVIEKGIGGGCELEALRVVASMPKWKPAKQNGKAVSVKYTLPIVFAVSQE
ncbi:MAG: tetratricopeptide repeat protein [Bacteroidota bacterium]|nr:tetratricopeptide repeat protein [Bacteroidota bacterium]